MAEGKFISGFTRDISNIGVFFSISSADVPSVGQSLSFVIELPGEVTLSDGCRIQCLSKVLRVNDLSNAEVGVAAQLLEYSFLS